jgi:putative methionine-R-sulfoxide reductase with GAF domain
MAESLATEVEALLREKGVSDAVLGTLLQRVLDHFDCVVGTIHALDAGLLHLRAQRGIPTSIQDKVDRIPVGKGMAGLAAARREPVQVCNLQTDASGVAKPGAKETRMEGSIAVPMLHDGVLCGVLGVAKPVVHEFTPAETALLQQIAGIVGKYLVGRPTNPSG